MIYLPHQFNLTKYVSISELIFTVIAFESRPNSELFIRDFHNFPYYKKNKTNQPLFTSKLVLWETFM